MADKTFKPIFLELDDMPGYSSEDSSVQQTEPLTPSSFSKDGQLTHRGRFSSRDKYTSALYELGLDSLASIRRDIECKKYTELHELRPKYRQLKKLLTNGLDTIEDYCRRSSRHAQYRVRMCEKLEVMCMGLIGTEDAMAKLTVVNRQREQAVLEAIEGPGGLQAVFQEVSSIYLKCTDAIDARIMKIDKLGGILQSVKKKWKKELKHAREGMLKPRRTAVGSLAGRNDEMLAALKNLEDCMGDITRIVEVWTAHCRDVFLPLLISVIQAVSVELDEDSRSQVLVQCRETLRELKVEIEGLRLVALTKNGPLSSLEFPKLQSILGSGVMRGYFSRYLDKNLKSENLQFFDAVSQFRLDVEALMSSNTDLRNVEKAKTLLHSDSPRSSSVARSNAQKGRSRASTLSKDLKKSILRLADPILDMYIRSEGQQQVNIPGSLRKVVLSYVDTPSMYMFDEAQEHVFRLMDKDCRLSFRHSALGMEMLLRLSHSYLPEDYEQVLRPAEGIVIDLPVFDEEVAQSSFYSGSNGDDDSMNSPKLRRGRRSRSFRDRGFRRQSSPPGSPKSQVWSPKTSTKASPKGSPKGRGNRSGRRGGRSARSLTSSSGLASSGSFSEREQERERSKTLNDKHRASPDPNSVTLEEYLATTPRSKNDSPTGEEKSALSSVPTSSIDGGKKKGSRRGSKRGSRLLDDAAGGFMAMLDRTPPVSRKETVAVEAEKPVANPSPPPSAKSPRSLRLPPLLSPRRLKKKEEKDIAVDDKAGIRALLSQPNQSDLRKSPRKSPRIRVAEKVKTRVRRSRTIDGGDIGGLERKERNRKKKVKKKKKTRRRRSGSVVAQSVPERATESEITVTGDVSDNAEEEEEAEEDAGKRESEVNLKAKSKNNMPDRFRANSFFPISTVTRNERVDSTFSLDSENAAMESPRQDHTKLIDVETSEETE